MSNYGEGYYLEDIEEMIKEKVVTIIPDKQIIIDKNDLDFIHKQYKDKITDLEAKLAESENKIYELMTKLNMKEYAPVFCRLAGRECEELGTIDQLKQQLAEKDQAIENWKTMYESVMNTCNNDAKEIERLREQLAEKEIEELKKGSYKVTLGTTPSNQIDFTENFYVIQNQTAIAELEKLKHDIIYYDTDADFNNDVVAEFSHIVFKLIDQQIKSLKGEKE